jgi:hypothetical protein
MVTDTFWKILDFAKIVDKHYNTVYNWFNKLEERAIHYTNRVGEDKIYDQLDLEIALFIKDKRDQKWAVDAIFEELPNHFELRPFPLDYVFENPQSLDMVTIKREVEKVLTLFASTKLEEMKIESERKLLQVQQETSDKIMEVEIRSEEKIKQIRQDIENQSLSKIEQVKAQIEQESTAKIEQLKAELHKELTAKQEADAKIQHLQKEIEESKKKQELIETKLNTPANKTEDKQQKITDRITEKRVEHKLEMEALGIWSQKPESERLVKVGWFKKIEDIEKRDKFVKEYVREHFEQHLKAAYGVE